MVYTNLGIKELGKVGIQNVTGEWPTHQSFLGSDNTYTGSEITGNLSNEYIRKAVAWSTTGNNSKWIVQLASTEAIGSFIGAISLLSGANIGSDTLININRSFIGNKTSAFNVQVEGEIIINRVS